MKRKKMNDNMYMYNIAKMIRIVFSFYQKTKLSVAAGLQSNSIRDYLHEKSLF